MLQNTLLRLGGLDTTKPIVVCGDEYRFMVAEQIRELGGQADIILEPVGRNTAPAVALAALHASAQGDDPLLLVLAADHEIGNVAAFHRAVEEGIPAAERGELVTFGVVPTHAETGYGYIKAASCQNVSAVLEFVEKPDAPTAQAYLETGQYLWNSGMFLFKASAYLSALGTFCPDMLAACQAAIATETPDLDFIRVDEQAFADCPSDSIDYAVMERASNAVVVPLDAQWSDVGSWSALYAISDKDEAGNVFQGDVIALQTRDCYVRAEHKLIAAIGLDNVIVVETKDALLVASQEAAQQVKDIVASIQATGRGEHEYHREVYRPWGKYDSIDEGDRYQVKRITVKPGQRLSVQMHHHRAEHWIVVAGTAKVYRGDEEILLSENQSVYIPIGTVHALENPGKIPLELIEVQSGTYLGEDDIVRFDDWYGRG
jgi:mannose-1-phosphate guanylyltransferase